MDAPYTFGFEATFLDGAKRTGVSLNASTATVEIAYARLQEGDAETHRQLSISQIQRRRDSDVTAERPRSPGGRERFTMTEDATTATPVQRIVMPSSGLFLVERTSSWSGKPCDEAFEAETTQVDRRNTDDPKKIPAHRGTDGDWYQKGTNHRVEDGNICRDVGWQREWFVRLSDVMAFVDKYGECVVGRDSRGFATIEIYDGCRE